MQYDYDGIKYFTNICTIDLDKDKYYMILPEDIKRYIWDLLHIQPVIECSICSKVLIRIDIDVRVEIICENFIQINKTAICNEC